MMEVVCGKIASRNASSETSTAPSMTGSATCNHFCRIDHKMARYSEQLNDVCDEKGSFGGELSEPGHSFCVQS